MDYIFTFTQIVEKTMARNQETRLFYVDLKKAYDSVPVVKLWQTLEKININGKLIKAYKFLSY